MIYLDTSALVKLLTDEAERVALLAWLDARPDARRLTSSFLWKSVCCNAPGGSGHRRCEAWMPSTWQALCLRAQTS